jgi:hypothetical protein
MDFMGFVNGDFDFFKKKAAMAKPEYDEKKEEVKRHFRELCYQVQKQYHSVTGGTLLLDKDFQGLNKNKNHISAKCKIDEIDFAFLSIELNGECVSINLISPPDGDYLKFEKFREAVKEKSNETARFFKEERSAILALYKLDVKKAGEDAWKEEFKFLNREMCSEDYKLLLENMERLQPIPYNSRKSAGAKIKIQHPKSEVVRVGKMLPSRLCTELISFLKLCGELSK